MTKVLRSKLIESIRFFVIKPPGQFDMLILFSHGFQQERDARFAFGLCSNLPASVTWSDLVQLCCLPFFRYLTNGCFFDSAIPVKVVGSNSLINLLILRPLRLIELFCDQEPQSRLPCLTDVYNNGESVNKGKRLTQCLNQLEGYEVNRIL